MQDNDPNTKPHYQRIKEMTEQRQRVITAEQRQYMENHPLAEKSAASLIRFAEDNKISVRDLHHRYDILKAIDNYFK